MTENTKALKKKILFYPHGFDLNSNAKNMYKTYQEALNDILLGYESVDLNNKKKGIQKYLNTLGDVEKPWRIDTSIGGNEVINPYPGGHEDDDIVFPINATDTSCKRGIGYVYKEAIQDTQKILWLTFGIPKFNDLEGFYGFDGKAGDTSAYSQAVNEGGDTENSSFFGEGSLFGKFVGSTLGKAAKLAIHLPFAPARAYNWIVGETINDEITKYYDFEPATIQYYKLVNSLIGELAVGMGLYGQGNPASSVGNVTSEAFGDGSAVNVALESEANPESAPEKLGVPEILKNGPDIFSIMDKRFRWGDGQKNPVRNMDQSDNLAQTALNFKEAFEDAYQGADQYIGFRVEKSTDSYESISNSTGESQIASTLNNTSQEIRASMFSFMGVGFGGDKSSVTSRIQKTVSDLGGSAMDLISSAIGRPNFAGTATTLFTGNGYFDIPEVWKSSSFTKSYTFSVELESRLGDPVSIYQNIYIPLCCLLAAATPRAVGKNMYTSPFILQAYVQGMFAIPLGIIDSITIKRGSADYGWSKQGLPTTVNVSFSIKDLSPALFLSLYGEGFMNIFTSNSSMHEYLATLSGLGVLERKRIGKRLMRKLNAALALNRTTMFNPIYWASSWGNNKFVRMFGSLKNKGWPD